jgi:hypothetical protein
VHEWERAGRHRDYLITLGGSAAPPARLRRCRGLIAGLGPASVDADPFPAQEGLTDSNLASAQGGVRAARLRHGSKSRPRRSGVPTPPSSMLCSWSQRPPEFALDESPPPDRSWAVPEFGDDLRIGRVEDLTTVPCGGLVVLADVVVAVSNRPWLAGRTEPNTCGALTRRRRSRGSTAGDAGDRRAPLSRARARAETRRPPGARRSPRGPRP